MIPLLLLAAHAAEPPAPAAEAPATVVTRVLLVEHCGARPSVTERTSGEGAGPVDLTLLRAAVAELPDMTIVSAPMATSKRGEPASISIGAADLGTLSGPEWSMQLQLDTPVAPEAGPTLTWTWERRWRDEDDPEITNRRNLSTALIVPLDRVTDIPLRPEGDETCPGGHTLFATAHHLEGDAGVESFRQKLVSEKDRTAARFSSKRRAARRREAREVLATAGLGAR